MAQAWVYMGYQIQYWTHQVNDGHFSYVTEDDEWGIKNRKGENIIKASDKYKSIKVAMMVTSYSKQKMDMVSWITKAK